MLTSSQMGPASGLDRELEFAQELARGAGDILRSFYDVPPVVGWKAGDEPVTEADRAANAFLVGEIAKAFPGDGILAEESHDDLSRLSRRRIWLVDPVDGTTEFIAHNDEFCVMLALVEEGRPQLGVIYEPMADLLFTARYGGGAFVEAAGERRRLRVSDTAALPELRSAVSRSHRSPLIDEINQALGVDQEQIIGSMGLKSAALALGRVDFYIHPAGGPREWDTGAPEVILREAGGVITDCWNRPLRYNQRDIGRPFGVLASNAVCRERLASRVTLVLEGLGMDPEVGF